VSAVGPPRVALALIGAALALLLAEGVARLQGDRLCAETPGAFYQADARFGWTHVPYLGGWVRRCEGVRLPAIALDANSRGLLDFERPYAKPPDRVRFLLLGGDLVEGLGVRGSATLARMLEQRVDGRRGPRLEVINAGIGGFALDNDLLYLRHEGSRYAPDVVLVVVDPARELAELSPALAAASGARVPAKPLFRLDGDRIVPVSAPAADAAAPPAPSGLARLQLYRLLAGIPSRAGPLLGWLAPPAGVPAREAARAEALAVARGVLEALRDEASAAHARLAVVVAPAPAGNDDGPAIAALAQAAGIPTLDLAPAFDGFTKLSGRPGFFPGTTHWDADGHFVAGEAVWRFLGAKGLLPDRIVPALVLGGGKVVELDDFAHAFAETLWRGRHALFSTFVQLALLAVAVVWAGACLPPAARDWLLVLASLSLVGALGTPALALAALVYGVGFHVAVERLPRRAAEAAALVLLVAMVVVPVVWLPRWLPSQEVEPRQYFGFATNVALLRFAAYAWDRLRGGLPARPLREFLGAMFFFPTFVNGPIESAAEFAERRPPGGVAPGTFAALGEHLGGSARALARLAWGAVKIYTALLLLNRLNDDVFASGGAIVGHPRLWLWTAELYANFYVIFSGWSDVSIALGRMVGSSVAENFDRPWAAPDVADFWNRWHVSFGRWLRRYVYIPLGGNRRHVMLNIMVVFLVSGLWHVWGALKLLGLEAYPPAAWTGFVLWGVMNGAGVVVAHRRRGAARTLPPRLAQAATFVFVSLTWVPFFMPPWFRLGACLDVFARLAFLR
jgi:D-alanyl-lipoteichoic acid acyltransferase DltB (MBOAT superfamily)